MPKRKRDDSKLTIRIHYKDPEEIKHGKDSEGDYIEVDIDLGML